MVSINLLNDERRSARQDRRRSRSAVLVVVCVLAVVVTGWGWVAVGGSQTIERLEQEVQDKRGRLALMVQQQNLVLTLQEQRDAMAAEHETLDALTRGLDRPVRLLSMISQVVDPLDVWLRQLQATDEKVTLSGVARAHEGIWELAKNLEHTDMLGQVDVFEIRAHVSQPELFLFSMNVFMDDGDHG